MLFLRLDFVFGIVEVLVFFIMIGLGLLISRRKGIVIFMSKFLFWEMFLYN